MFPKLKHMFNVLIAGDGIAWESEQRLEMPSERFLEHSGDESENISVEKPKSLKVLERIQSVLLYEGGAGGKAAGIIRLGQLRDIRPVGRSVTFRFAETGRIPSAKFEELRYRLQISDWEMHRTHWAVKDGDIPQELFAEMVPSPKKYDVVLSFAGEDREYVGQVADFLESHDVIVFYDKYEEVTLWGKDLVEHFDGVYRKQGRFCIMFISRHYADKVWTNHERRSALARALEERAEYVLPARFDDTEIPGLRPSMSYQDLRTLTPQQLGERILQKLGRK
jgi:hypothetical protein